MPHAAFPKERNFDVIAQRTGIGILSCPPMKLRPDGTSVRLMKDWKQILGKAGGIVSPERSTSPCQATVVPDVG